MDKQLKRWKRFRHSFKGDIWTKRTPKEFKKCYGSGWILIETADKIF